MSAKRVQAPVELGQIQPQAPELEQAVLGAVLLDRNAVHEVSGFLKPEHFYVDAHGAIWENCLAMHAEDEPIDLLTVRHRMKKTGELDIVGGDFYLVQLTRKVAASTNIEFHARIIVQEFIAREVIRHSAQSIKEGFADRDDAFDLADRSERRITGMMEGVAIKTSVRIGDVANEQMEKMTKRMDDPKNEAHKIRSTGFEALDKALGGGFSNGDLIIIAGRPGMGKSSLSFSMAYNAAERGEATGLFSLELGESKTNARLQSMGTGVPLTKILSGELNPAEFQKIQEHHARYINMPLFTNFNNGLNLVELRSEIGRMVRRHKITAAFIDQLVWVDAGAVRDPVAAITKAGKKIAMEFDIPIIFNHQLSRANVTRGGDKRPDLTDLRDSGHAEQNAQVVIFAHRPEYYHIFDDAKGSTAGRGELIIAKNSNGDCDTVDLYFDGPCTAYRAHAPFAQTTMAVVRSGDDEPPPF